MTPRIRAELVQALRHRRAALLKQVSETEDDLRTLAEDREPEREECAQAESAARLLVDLDERDLREMAEIHAALQRIVDRTYGTCVDCGVAIPLTRLRALPTAEFCIECARAEEAAPRERPEPAPPDHPGTLSPDLAVLMDREVEEAVRELIRDDGRVDAAELRLLCHHGIVYLDGAVPSERQHVALLQLVTDVAGCADVVDHVQVDVRLRERPDVASAPPEEIAAPVRSGESDRSPNRDSAPVRRLQ